MYDDDEMLEEGSRITIAATRLDGTIIEEKLICSGFPNEYIFYSPDISEIVNSETSNGREILDNIQKFYGNEMIDEMLENDEIGHPLRSINNINELIKIELKEELFDFKCLSMIRCIVLEGEYVGELYEAEEITAIFEYDIKKNEYSKNYEAVDEDGNKLWVIQEYDNGDWRDISVEEHEEIVTFGGEKYINGKFVKL